MGKWIDEKQEKVNVEKFEHILYLIKAYLNDQGSNPAKVRIKIEMLLEKMSLKERQDLTTILVDQNILGDKFNSIVQQFKGAIWKFT